MDGSLSRLRHALSAKTQELEAALVDYRRLEASHREALLVANQRRASFEEPLLARFRESVRQAGESRARMVARFRAQLASARSSALSAAHERDAMGAANEELARQLEAAQAELERTRTAEVAPLSAALRETTAALERATVTKEELKEAKRRAREAEAENKHLRRQVDQLTQRLTLSRIQRRR